MLKYLFLLLISIQVFAAKPIKLRIGWQVPWATQGQIVQILKHTDILKKNGIQAEFIGRTFGPMLNELALAEQIDVVLTADQPAAALFSKERSWIGVGRLMYNRTSTYVPAKSEIKNLAQLKGKTIGIPIGAAAERVTMEALVNAGLDPKKDVKIINLDIKEQGPLVTKNKDAKNWDTIDALSGFDPTPAIFEAKGLVRTLDVGKVVSLVIMNENFIKKNPKVATQLMQSIADAYHYYQSHTEEANKWFMNEAHLDGADQSACNIAASLEPNLKAKNKKGIRVTFIDSDFVTMQKAADFIEAKLNKKVDMKKFVTNEYAKDVKLK